MRNLLVILMDPMEKLHLHYCRMVHCWSHLIKMIVQRCPVKKLHGKEMMEDWIYNPLTPPLHELMASLSSPEPQSIIIVEIVHHVIAPTEESIDGVTSFISRVDFVGIHTLPNL